MIKKIAIAAFIGLALAGCDEKPVVSQQNTSTVKYGRTHVALLADKDVPPGCDMWAVYPWFLKDGIRYQENRMPIYVTVCQGEVLPSKTEWRQQSGKVTYDRKSFTSRLGGEE
jgi:hypothetical protein